MTASEPWEFDIPLNDHDDFLYRKKKYSPKHLRRHSIAVRPALLLLPIIVAFLLGFAAGSAIIESKPVIAVSDTPTYVRINSPFAIENIQKVPVTYTEIPVAELIPETAEPIQETIGPAPESIRHRDDIVSDGRLLDYDLQDAMHDFCEKYDVPYALALAVAEVESHFDPDAKSSTNDYGLMQINAVNFDWLRDLGMDPLTPEGNIESGVYILAQNLQAYGDPELALMAYNNGPGGAKMLWDRGIYQTAYSQKVMAAFAKWTSILETRP